MIVGGGAPGSSGANRMLDQLSELKWLAVTWGLVWLVSTGYLVFMILKEIVMGEYKWVLKINTSAKHTYVPFRNEDEVKVAADKIQDVFLNE